MVENLFIFLKKNYKTFLILFFLIFGVLFRIGITSSGNFIFHTDNARDAVDVREMVVLHKLRLIGPTSGIEGFYNGPFWYYFLSVPFIISSGDPYSFIIFEILLWVIGGYFLLKFVQPLGKLESIFAGSLWIASNLIILSTQQSLSPNTIVLLMPLFIYLFDQYLRTGKLKFSLGIWLLAGLFFQFEMAFGVFMPIIIPLAVILSKNKKYFITQEFWKGVLIFTATLLPQILFDFRHGFLLIKSIFGYLTQSINGGSSSEFIKITSLKNLYSNVFSALFMNVQVLIFISLAIFIVFFLLLSKKRNLSKNNLLVISLLLIFIPFLGYLILPIVAMPWHVQASSVSSLLILVLAINKFKEDSWGKILSFFFVGLTLFFTVVNINDYWKDKDFYHPNSSLYKNEVAAIDYVYKKAVGENFKVYIYLPSIIDYPYQYLFWWYGQKKYGYLPVDYAYLPGKPRYISNKELFMNPRNNSAKIIFLIKQPDEIGQRHLWENNFTNLPLVSTIKIGSLEIEERKEI